MMASIDSYTFPNLKFIFIEKYNGEYVTTKIKASISLIKESNDRLKNGYRSDKKYTENLTYSEINTLLKTAFYNTFNNSKQILE